MQQRRKIMTVFGTRPEGTKMAPVIEALKQHTDWFDVVVVNTGQHREQLDQVFEAYNFQPDHDLAIMQPNQTLAQIFSRIMMGLDAVIKQERPDMVLVHGDTSTTSVGAIAAFYSQVKVGHVEAGLRTFDKFNPFPEEINRRMAGILADVHFAPTGLNRDNLLREQVDPDTIFVTGQTGVDVTVRKVGQEHTFVEPRLREIDFEGHRVIAFTAHRRENQGEPMQNMFRAARALVDRYEDTLLVYPVHLSPAVRDAAHSILGGHPRIVLIDPISHPDMLHLMARSYMVMSDSGGLQEETPTLGVPQVLMRETTERPEAVEAGVIIQAGTSYEGVYRGGESLLTDSALYKRMAAAKNPFGDGKASQRIAQYLGWYFGLANERPAEFRVD